MWHGSLIFGSAYLLVMMGGALGSLFRFMIVNRFVFFDNASGFPIGTLFVNIMGSFLMGVLVGLIPKNSTGYLSGPLFWFIGIGFLGGFTTFSSFALDFLNMLYSDSPKYLSGVYLVVSVFGSIAACFGGFWIVRSIFS